MTPQEIQKLTAQLKLQAQYQKRVTENFDGYMAGLKELKDVQIEHNNLLKERARLIEEEKLIVDKTSDAWHKNNAETTIANQQLEKLKTKAEALGGALDKVNKKTTFGAKGLSESVKLIGKSFELLQVGFNKIKGFGLFEMDKAMKTSALSMGILSKQTDAFNASIKGAALKTNMIGFGLEDAAKAQASYSEELGRTVMLGEEGLVAIGQMAKATGMGAEEAAKMAAEFENQGMSAERAAKFVEDSLNNSHKMGLNASKVVKTIQNNMKMLNKYNFKAGTKGLEKMAELVTKLGVDMEFASGFADKLWNVEGAVEMSAQLQVMGGQWAQLADPFALMYKARNDMAGLTEEIANAAASSAKFNKETGEFDMSAQEMHRLKIIADQTGLSYDDLAKAGKNAAKFAKIKGQASFDFGSGPEAKALKEFVTNTSELDEQGRAQITVGVTGEKKFLSQLTQGDKKILLAQIEEKKTMEERAKAATTFDEQVTFLINQIKIFALPLVEVMNKRLIPKIQELSDKFTAKGGFGEKIMYLAEKIGELVSWGVGFMIDNPITTGIAYLATKVVPMFFGFAQWYKNGQFLAMGFNSKSTKGGGLSDLADAGEPTSFGGKMKGRMTGRAMKGAGIAGLIGAGVDIANQNELFGKEGTTGHKVAGVGASALEWGATGAMIGTMIAPGIGTAIGAAIGGLGGAIRGAYNEGVIGDKQHDAVFQGFKKGLGSDFNKGRGVVQGGKIHPIDNKDDLIAMKPKGIMDQNMGSTNNMATTTKIEFGTLTVNGTIVLQSSSNLGASEDLMKNPGFKRDFTSMVQAELEKNKNYGKNRG